MFKSNSLFAIFAVLPLSLILSCNSETSKNESGPEKEVTSFTDTIVIRDTVFVTEVEDSIKEKVNVLHASVNSTKTNILYEGVENPLSITLPEVDSENVSATISNGSIRKLGNSTQYVVTVQPGIDAVLNVFVDEDGVIRQVGSYHFRVKSVPDPKPFFAGKGVGDDEVTKNAVTAAQGVAARMVNFDFDIKFTVTSFKMTMIIGGTPIEKSAKGNRLTGEMKSMLKKAKRGQKIYVESIRAKGPDGSIRKIGSLAFKVI